MNLSRLHQKVSRQRVIYFQILIGILSITAIILLYRLWTTSDYYFTPSKWSAVRFFMKSNVYNRLKSNINCNNRDFVPETVRHGNFWLLKNYVRAEHGSIDCHESVTYTTHGDFTFLDNLEPLLKRWHAPISIAIYAPGTDFEQTVQSIAYVRQCLHRSDLVQFYVTFHIFFESDHLPESVYPFEKAQQTVSCAGIPPYNVPNNQTYIKRNSLIYQANVARNIARDTALTHFVLASDIELYPSPDLVPNFLRMIARMGTGGPTPKPRVYPLPIFEIKVGPFLPTTKHTLKNLIQAKKAFLFHEHICSYCHKVPFYEEWIEEDKLRGLNVFRIGKRMNQFKSWEPIFIGTHHDPHYEERLNWDGMRDKMSQGYVMCVMDYEYHVLDNAFLIHKPGIKVLVTDKSRNALVMQTNEFIGHTLEPELKKLFGANEECSI